jgi:hypothetical protein
MNVNVRAGELNQATVRVSAGTTGSEIFVERRMIVSSLLTPIF